jgi:hypothetical protein
MTTETVRRVVRASAFYDLIVTAGFATPWTAALALGTVTDVHRGLGLDGALPQVDDPFTMLFANLLGSIVVVWSVVRLIRPTAFLGAGDTVGRLLFSAWFAWALLEGASPVLVGFLVLEVGWGLVQGYAVWKPVTVRWRESRGRTLAAC